MVILSHLSYHNFNETIQAQYKPSNLSKQELIALRVNSVMGTRQRYARRSVNGTELEVGMDVAAKWQDGVFYKATILSLLPCGNKVKVKYEVDNVLQTLLANQVTTRDIDIVTCTEAHESVQQDIGGLPLLAWDEDDVFINGDYLSSNEIKLSTCSEILPVAACYGQNTVECAELCDPVGGSNQTTHVGYIDESGSMITTFTEMVMCADYLCISKHISNQETVIAEVETGIEVNDLNSVNLAPQFAAGELKGNQMEYTTEVMDEKTNGPDSDYDLPREDSDLFVSNSEDDIVANDSESNSQVSVLEKMDILQEGYDSDYDPAYEESEMSSSDSEDEFESHGTKEVPTDLVSQTLPLQSSQPMETPSECHSLAVPAAARYTEIKSRMANVSVPVYTSKDGKKNYTRLDYCYFCEKGIKSRVSRHYSGVHGDQEVVKEILKTTGIERQNKLFSLQNLGNLKHNTKVLKAGEGELVVVKRPSKPTPACKVLPCTYCYGFYAVKSLKLHVNTCPAGPTSNRDSHSIAASRMYMMSVMTPSTDDHKDFEELIGGLTETRANPGLARMIKEDDVILAFAKGLLLRLGERELRRPGTTDIGNIRNKIRTIARLLAIARRQSEDISFNQLLLPCNFNMLLQSAREMSKRCPQTGLTIGGFIKQLNLHVISNAINSNDCKRQQLAQNFSFLFDTHWRNNITSVAGKRQRLKATSKDQQLPLTQGMKELSTFLRAELANFNQKDPSNVAKYALAYLVLFNKRRPMEVAELKVSHFLAEMHQDINDNEQITASLDATEKALAKRMKAIAVRGKSTKELRKVFIVIPDYLLAALISLAKPSKMFLFQRPCSAQPLNGTAAVRDAVKACPNLRRPDLLHAQRFRKYLATTCQVLDMDEEQLRLVASHMGHNLNVHMSVYRVQQNLMERSKMAKVLIAAEQGTLHVQKDTELDCINADDLLIYDDVQQSLIIDQPSISESSSGVSESAVYSEPKEASGATTSSSGIKQKLLPLNTQAECESFAVAAATRSIGADDHASVVSDQQQKGRKRRWTEEEINNFSTLAQPLLEQNQPIGKAMKELQRLLPKRTPAQIRTRFSNIMLKK